METSSIYERTGITGPFEISSIALVFPDTSHMDLTALAADIEANGLLEEITLAMTQRPGGHPDRGMYKRDYSYEPSPPHLDSHLPRNDRMGLIVSIWGRFCI